MGNQVSLVPKVSYEDIQMIVYRNLHVPNSTLLINTLPNNLQHCLIKTTLDIRFEERIINDCNIKNMNIMIIVYGKNSNDITILHKYEQLVKLGFTNVHIYTGGIFEWLLLHEIYGKELFKITQYEIDMLRYRPKSVLLTEMMHRDRSAGSRSSGDIGQFIENTYPPDVAITIPDKVSDSDDSEDDDSKTESVSFLSGWKWLLGR